MYGGQAGCMVCGQMVCGQPTAIGCKGCTAILWCSKRCKSKDMAGNAGHAAVCSRVAAAISGRSTGILGNGDEHLANLMQSSKAHAVVAFIIGALSAPPIYIYISPPPALSSIRPVPHDHTTQA